MSEKYYIKSQELLENSYELANNIFRRYVSR